MKKIMIAPSILSCDFSAVGEAIKKIEENGADLVHLDVMDGAFVKNITFGPKMVKDIRKLTSLPLDAHLMINNPQNYVEVFANAGADIITVHYEACKENLKNVLLQIKALGKKCGAVINPDVPFEAIQDVLPICDMVLLMSVFPGFGGQKFIESVLDKIKQTKVFNDENNLDIDIEIDGGITEENVEKVKKAGANVIVAGNTVFSSKDMAKTIKNLRG